MPSSPQSNARSEVVELSFAPGGALYQLWRRRHPSTSAVDGWRGRLLAMPIVAWVPLLVLSIVEGNAWGSEGARPFLKDVETQLRLLLALPLLIVAERVAHARVPRVAGMFVERGIISDASRPKFDAAVAAMMCLRNSLSAELLLIAFVYGIGATFVWRTQIALALSSWYAAPKGDGLEPTLAGWWMLLVSLPLFQFLLLRWYFRLLVWARFLWQVARIDLVLVPTHPDRRAGLGFLARVCRAFSPVLLAQGTILSGLIANRIFHAGAKLLDFKLEIVGTVALVLFAILGPLLVFTPMMRAARAKGVDEYGTLAERYVQEFDRKWVHCDAPPDEPLLGSPDVQSLADLGNTFGVVASMRWTPFTMQNVTQLAATTLLPVAPLLLTTFSVEELVERVLKVVL